MLKNNIGEIVLDILMQEENVGFICHEIITPEVTSDVTGYKGISVTFSSHSEMKLNKSRGQDFQRRVTEV